MRLSIRLCLLFFLGSSTPSFGEDWVRIDFDPGKAKIEDGSWDLRIGDRETRACVRKGAPTVQPKIVPGGVAGGGALRIELDPTSGLGPDNGRDKINYTVIKGSAPNAPTFDGRAVYFSFSIRLDPNHFEAPTTGRGYVIAQWWQGTPFSPPLSLQLDLSDDPAKSPHLVFSIKNEDTGANPSAQAIQVPLTANASMDRGKWYSFVVETRFDYRGNGSFRAWVNGADAASWTGKLGYDPSTTAEDLGFKTGKTNARPNRNIELYIGPYRDRMDSTQVFEFDRIRYGPAPPVF